MRIGDKWQRVEVIGESDQELELTFDGGSEFRPIQLWRMRCDCGEVFEVRKSEMRKKLYKDCGCGIADRDGRKVIAGPYTVPESTLNKIEEYAAENTSGNLSHAVTLLVRKATESKWEEK